MFQRIFLAALLSFLAAPVFSQNLSHLKVELLCEQNSIQPSGSVTVGFHFIIQKGWHVYWQNPGDSGQAPSITWTLPDGFTAGEILWPVPERITLPSLADYGYTREVTFLVPIQAPADLKAGHMVRLSATIHWLVCQEICIPGNKALNLRLPVRKKQSPYNSRYASIFKSARKNLPAPLPEEWSASGFLGPKEIHLSFDTGAPVAKTTTVTFFPLHGNLIHDSAKQTLEVSENTIHLGLKRSDQLSADVKTLEGLLVVQPKNLGKKGYWVQVPLDNPPPAAESPQ